METEDFAPSAPRRSSRSKSRKSQEDNAGGDDEVSATSREVYSFEAHPERTKSLPRYPLG